MKVSQFFLNQITEMLNLKHYHLGLLNAGSQDAADYANHVKNKSYFDTLEDHNNLNHPVHIVKSDGSVSPSAFIPFCDFGGNMTVVGRKIDQFPIPVCDKFKKTTLYDQVCYSIDLNEMPAQMDVREGFNKKKLGNFP